jgi:hypothetical protein
MNVTKHRHIEQIFTTTQVNTIDATNVFQIVGNVGEIGSVEVEGDLFARADNCFVSSIAKLGVVTIL